MTGLCFSGLKKRKGDWERGPKVERKEEGRERGENIHNERVNQNGSMYSPDDDHSQSNGINKRDIF